MFHFYKSITFFVDPVMLGSIWLIVTLLLLLGRWDSGVRWGRRMAILSLVVLVALSTLPLGIWALVPLENRFAKPVLPEKAQGIVLLTGDESPIISSHRNLATGGAATSRYVHLARLAKKYSDAKIVIAGRTGRQIGDFTTQTISKDILTSIGVPLARVTFEEKSRTTHENAVFTYEQVKPKKGETWILLTSAFHMPRSVLSFEKAGWTVVPVPSDYKTYGEYTIGFFPHIEDNISYLSTAGHEYFGLLSYWLTGRIDRLWP